MLRNFTKRSTVLSWTHCKIMQLNFLVGSGVANLKFIYTLTLKVVQYYLKDLYKYKLIIALPVWFRGS
jgi:hypothetical protein